MSSDKKKKKPDKKQEEHDLTRDEFFRVLRPTSAPIKKPQEDQPDEGRSETSE